MDILKRYILFFIIGSAGYGLVEILWRGKTHWTMLIAGGICFMLFSLVAERLKKRSLVLKAIICALIITLVELLFGLIFNVMLNMNIWNYSNIPLNFYGQICPFFSVMWACLSFALLPLVDKLNSLLIVDILKLQK